MPTFSIVLYKFVEYHCSCNVIVILKFVCFTSFNSLKTSPEYTQAGVYGKCMLYYSIPKSNRLQCVKESSNPIDYKWGCMQIIFLSIVHVVQILRS